MKKIISILAVLLTLSLIIYSCNRSETSENFDKLQNASSDLSTARVGGPNPCPEGQVAYFELEFDSFHFHRPVTGCASGFWFCTKPGGGFKVKCKPAFSTSLVASIQGRTATVWAQDLGEQIEMHFLIGLKTNEGYTAEDLETFNVDEDYTIYEGITLKKGDYEVVETIDELVVLVDKL